MTANTEVNPRDPITPLSALLVFRHGSLFRARREDACKAGLIYMPKSSGSGPSIYRPSNIAERRVVSEAPSFTNSLYGYDLFPVVGSESVKTGWGFVKV